MIPLAQLTAQNAWDMGMTWKTAGCSLACSGLQDQGAQEVEKPTGKEMISSQHSANHVTKPTQVFLMFFFAIHRWRHYIK